MGKAARRVMPRSASAASQYVILIAQIAFCVFFIYQFRIESEAFSRFSILVFFGFLIHLILPLVFQLPFFLLLAAASMVLVVGPLGAVWIVSIGLILIGIAHLPLAWPLRALLLAGAILALGWKSAVLKSQVPSLYPVLPIVGSMFAFRLFSYLHARENETPKIRKNESSLFRMSRTLSYFFLPSNVCFPLFPVVDYATFCETRLNEDALRIYQRGANRILRGILQILAYRVAYYYLAIDPSRVTEPWHVTRYLLANFFLFFRVTGQFDLAIGTLLLFGFNLPATSRWFCFSGSFVDFWNRANIYWRDFMQKMVFDPVYSRLRSFGHGAATTASVILVFLATGLLFTYQRFCVRGELFWKSTDILMWSALGLLVLFELLRQPAKKARTMVRQDQRWATARRVVSVMATFVVMSVLFSIWGSDSISEWLRTVSLGRISWGT